jgi:predicted DNA-binding transcriptional regulator YafY
MDLLDELGFEVSKDENNKFSLKADQIVDPFTKEESHLIQEVLTISVKNNPLVKSIKAKLPSLEETNILANNIVNGHLSKLVSQINEAILNKTQIIIHKYQSANTESITDRLVEPVGFTDNYGFLCAYEIESNQNKYFKVERMGSVELLDVKYKFESLHKLYKPDVFGFNDSGEKFNVRLRLSMRAQLWIKDDYPETSSYLKDLGNGSWLLEVEVFNMEPVSRIIRSMPDDIQLI